MKNYFIEIKKKLENNIDIEDLEIINNSSLHKTHKSFSPEKFHLHLKFKSKYLKSITRLNAQRLIMKVLKEDLKKRIHALEITIE